MTLFYSHQSQCTTGECFSSTFQAVRRLIFCLPYRTIVLTARHLKFYFALSLKFKLTRALLLTSHSVAVVGRLHHRDRLVSTIRYHSPPPSNRIAATLNSGRSFLSEPPEKKSIDGVQTLAVSVTALEPSVVLQLMHQTLTADFCWLHSVRYEQ